jgi:hypothetical protein
MAKKRTKRIAKAIGAGLAAYTLSKMMGPKSFSVETPVSGKDSEVGAVLSKKVSPKMGTYDEAGMKTTSAMMDKIKPARTVGYKPSDAMMKRRQAIADFEEKRRKTGISSGFEFMGFNKGGASVMARGCKLGRNKKTKIY